MFEYINLAGLRNIESPILAGVVMEMGDWYCKGLFLINQPITDEQSTALLIRLITKFKSQALIIFDDNSLSLTIFL